MSYYIRNQPGVGYIVCQLERDEVSIGCSFVRNFGYRQSDAIEFRNDCNNGKIDEKRIKLLIKTYTDQPYKYLGHGTLRKNKEEEQ